MTCVWKGILDCLKKKDFNKFKLDRKPKELEFVKLLKFKNRLCNSIICQETPLSKQFLDECFEAVKCFNEHSIYSGYYCSTCDPFIILVSELFNINIIHLYCGNIIHYKNKNAMGTIRVKSDRGHFQKM